MGSNEMKNRDTNKVAHTYKQPEWNRVHFSSQSCEWTTPQEAFDQLNAEFHFTLDACASEANYKCVSFFSKENNGLIQDWVKASKGGAIFVNPPYNKPEQPCKAKCHKKICAKRGYHCQQYQPGTGDWVAKAFEQSQRGVTVVMLLPARTDTEWFHHYCLRGELRAVKGRLNFNGASNGAPFPSMIVIFHKVEQQRKEISMSTQPSINAEARIVYDLIDALDDERNHRDRLLAEIDQAKEEVDKAKGQLSAKKTELKQCDDSILDIVAQLTGQKTLSLFAFDRRAKQEDLPLFSTTQPTEQPLVAVPPVAANPAVTPIVTHSFSKDGAMVTLQHSDWAVKIKAEDIERRLVQGEDYATMEEWYRVGREAVEKATQEQLFELWVEVAATELVTKIDQVNYNWVMRLSRPSHSVEVDLAEIARRLNINPSEYLEGLQSNGLHLDILSTIEHLKANELIELYFYYANNPLTENTPVTEADPNLAAVAEFFTPNTPQVESIDSSQPGEEPFTDEVINGIDAALQATATDLNVTLQDNETTEFGHISVEHENGLVLLRTENRVKVLPADVVWQITKSGLCYQENPDKYIYGEICQLDQEQLEYLWFKVAVAPSMVEVPNKISVEVNDDGSALLCTEDRVKFIPRYIAKRYAQRFEEKSLADCTQEQLAIVLYDESIPKLVPVTEDDSASPTTNHTQERSSRKAKAASSKTTSKRNRRTKKETEEVVL